MSRLPPIAIVDDDAAVCDSTRSLLEAYDFEVRTYLSGADFLRANPNVALLIVDYQMPGLNGLDVVSELRKRGGGVPTMMVTALIDLTLERRAAELGIGRILQKPVPSEAIFRAIQVAMA